MCLSLLIVAMCRHVKELSPVTVLRLCIDWPFGATFVWGHFGERLIRHRSVYLRLWFG